MSAGLRLRVQELSCLESTARVSVARHYEGGDKPWKTRFDCRIFVERLCAKPRTPIDVRIDFRPVRFGITVFAPYATPRRAEMASTRS